MPSRTYNAYDIELPFLIVPFISVRVLQSKMFLYCGLSSLSKII